MSRCMFCVSPSGFIPVTQQTDMPGSLVNRVDLLRFLLMTFLSHITQTSPDKNVNFPCTTAAFTLSPEPVGFVVLCQLARRLSLLCGFCSSSRTFALRLPSDPSSRKRPCLRLVLLIAFITYEYLRFSYRGLSPHKLTPMPGVHKLLQATRD